MIREISLADCLDNIDSFAYIFDVRSPSEFSHSHIPRAKNMPVLSDEQHHRVGLEYKRNSFQAKILGASLVCQNISSLLLELKDRIHPSMKLLIYCARGGQRSASLSMILHEIGYQVYRLSGGYKAYRSCVTTSLAQPPKLSFLTLCGPTGSGKSDLIKACQYGIDIEALALHLGSSFGHIKGKQPSAKMFQNNLFEALSRLEKTADRIALVECESKRLGSLVLPTPLVNAYQRGIKIYIDSPLKDRIKRIVQEYGQMDTAFFDGAMDKIKRYMSQGAWIACKEAFRREDKTQCAEILLLEYYDKIYKQSDCDFTLSHKDVSTTLQAIDSIKKTCFSDHNH